MSCSSMKKIGLITCNEFTNLYYDDQYLLAPFAQKGIELIPVVWDKPTDFNQFDLLIFKSAWDYHQKTVAFEHWLQFLKTIKTPICNPISIIEQNYNKYYLKDLQEKGFPVIPTLFFDDVRPLALSAILEENGWEKAVIKPVISMSAYHTYSFDKTNHQHLQDNLVNYYSKTSVMVQKFTPEIITEGEWSIIFFDKKYCISALKKPKKGDFRVQGELGGTITYPEPPTHIIQEAQNILNNYPEDILYARMDGIIHQGHFQLMEAELIDPELYFRSGEKVQNAFLTAVMKRLEMKNK